MHCVRSSNFCLVWPTRARCCLCKPNPSLSFLPFNPLPRGWHWNGRKALKDMRLHHQPFHFLCCLSQLCMEDGGGGLMDWRCRLLSCSTCAHSWDECFSRRNYLCVCVERERETLCRWSYWMHGKVICEIREVHLQVTYLVFFPSTLPHSSSSPAVSLDTNEMASCRNHIWEYVTAQWTAHLLPARVVEPDRVQWGLNRVSSLVCTVAS